MAGPREPGRQGPRFMKKGGASGAPASARGDRAGGAGVILREAGGARLAGGGLAPISWRRVRREEGCVRPGDGGDACAGTGAPGAGLPRIHPSTHLLRQAQT
jgi:hypothetical protein